MMEDVSHLSVAKPYCLPRLAGDSRLRLCREGVAKIWQTDENDTCIIIIHVCTFITPIYNVCSVESVCWSTVVASNGDSAVRLAAN